PRPPQHRGRRHPQAPLGQASARNWPLRRSRHGRARGKPHPSRRAPGCRPPARSSIPPQRSERPLRRGWRSIWLLSGAFLTLCRRVSGGQSLLRPRRTPRRTMMSNKMWGGRFGEGPDRIMEEINASIGFDQRFYAQDIRGSKAHAAMLAEKGIISREDADKIVAGLDAVLAEI